MTLRPVPADDGSTLAIHPATVIGVSSQPHRPIVENRESDPSYQFKN